MQYVYLDLIRIIKKIYIANKNSFKDASNIFLSFNIDGVPLFKSTKNSLWPILCCINSNANLVFAVALTYGPSKPCNLSFMYNTVQCLNILLVNGLMINETKIIVFMTCFVCDAPAKAMVKSVKNFSGYYGCDKCTQKGSYSSKVIFPMSDGFTLRTDESYINQKGDHYKGISPLSSIHNMNMIQDFPIDYMHCCCLGVMKKLLNYWAKPSKLKCRVTPHLVRERD